MILRFIQRLYRYGIRSVPVLLICLSLKAYAADESVSPPEAENDSYIAELIKKAEAEKIWEDPEWIFLLHYNSSLCGIRSRVDDPAFFISPEGKNNPEKEIYATIRAMLDPVADENKKNPLYKYTARYNWLKKKLSIDENRIKNNYDEKFDTFFNEYKPTRISLVFPTGYMNNPASMFGHTFLLMESQEGSKLIAQTANYSAITEETFGPIFWFKGMFGFYPGYYSFISYYRKIQEYNDAEMRDMWEYELDLSGEEVKTLMRHVVEMENIYSDYYFLDENCSFNLLYLIEVAKPGVNLTDSFIFGVEPVDTIRVVKKNRLVVKRVYRPSLYSKIKHLKSLLSDDEQDMVLNICNGEQDISEIDKLGLSDKQKTVICDLSSEYLKFMVVKENVTQDDYRTRFMSVLRYRNNLPVIDNYRDIPEPPAPEEGHGSRRIAAEGGHDRDGWYSELSYRQTCHELMDPDEGFNQDSQVILGNVSGRYYSEENEFKFQRFDIVDVFALPLSDSFYISQCYNIKTGFVRNPWDDKWVQSYYLKGGTGYSTLLWDLVHVYILGGINSLFAGAYENNMDLQFGAESGLITSIGPWKNHIYGSAYTVPFGIEHTILLAGIAERININKAVALIAKAEWSKDFDESSLESSLKVSFYF